MENFTVYWKDEKTAYVDLTGPTVKITRYIKHPVKQIFAKDEMSRYDFGEILKSRCWDEHRDNIDKYLAKMELDEYNPYEIVKHTHGVMFGSFIWFRFDGETITAKDVLL